MEVSPSGLVSYTNKTNWLTTESFTFKVICTWMQMMEVSLPTHFQVLHRICSGHGAQAFVKGASQFSQLASFPPPSDLVPCLKVMAGPEGTAKLKLDTQVPNNNLFYIAHMKLYVINETILLKSHHLRSKYSLTNTNLFV